MISTVLTLPVGNALRLFLQPPAGALEWVILRKPADDFAAYPDPAAYQVYQGTNPCVVDAVGLTNGTSEFYRAYYLIAGSWVASATATGTPNATYQDDSTDALTVVRDRIDVGLQVEVLRGTLVPTSGAIAVLNAPPAFDDTPWPLVTIHLLNEQPAERSIGEDSAEDTFDPATGQWAQTEGWLARVQLAVIGWSKNPDERITLRKVLRRLIIANLQVFDAAGMIEIEFSQQDIDNVSGEYPANVFQTACTLTCSAPILVSDLVDPITDVQVTGLSTQ